MSGAAPTERPRRRVPVAALLAALVAILLLAAAPILSALGAGVVAEANGCSLDEGSQHPCVILGADRGELLYTMFVLGWLGLATLPIGAAALAVWFVVAVVLFVRSRL